MSSPLLPPPSPTYGRSFPLPRLSPAHVGASNASLTHPSHLPGRLLTPCSPRPHPFLTPPSPCLATPSHLLHFFEISLTPPSPLPRLAHLFPTPPSALPHLLAPLSSLPHLSLTHPCTLADPCITCLAPFPHLFVTSPSPLPHSLASLARRSIGSGICPPKRRCRPFIESSWPRASARAGGPTPPTLNLIFHPITPHSPPSPSRSQLSYPHPPSPPFPLLLLSPFSFPIPPLLCHPPSSILLRLAGGVANRPPPVDFANRPPPRPPWAPCYAIRYPFPRMEICFAPLYFSTG